MIPVPAEFRTRRLMLRPFAAEDAPALHDALVESLADLRAHLWFLPWVAEPQTLRSARARCRQAQESFQLRTDLPYLAFDLATGRLVGSMGLHRTDWGVPKTEIGCWVRTSECGKGYASEGVAPLIEWALTALRARRVEWVVDERNLGSRRVAERCGFALESIATDEGMRPDGTAIRTCTYVRVGNEN